MRRSLQRAALVGLGGYVLSLLLIGYEVVAHPEQFVHNAPLESLVLSVLLGTGLFLMIAAGAAIALAIFRSPPSDRSAVWFFLCGVLVYLLAWLTPTIPMILESCPPGQLCNPNDWGASLAWLRIPLFSFIATAVLVKLPRRSTRAH